MDFPLYLLIFYIMGGLYILFAFIKPPSFLEHFFKIPAILLFFVPDKYLMVVGRILTGLFLIGGGIFLQIYLADPSTYYNNFINNK